MFPSRMKCLALFVPVLLLSAVSTPAKAQAVSFGTVDLGQTSSSSTVTLTFSSAGTLGKELALAGGAQNQDFAIVSGGTCATGQSYQAGGSCTVSATFAPLYAGLRMGAVVLEDASGDVLASTYVSGVGSGPQAGFQTLTTPITEFSNLGITADKGLAIDGNGDIFVSNFNSTTERESVVEVPAGCTQASCVKQLPGTFGAVWGLALDGAGNLWVGNVSAAGTITEIPAANGYSALKTYSGAFGNQYGVTVDGGGNVYFVTSQAGAADSVMELTEASGYTTVKTLATDINVSGGLALDSSGDVFYVDTAVAGIEEIVAVNGSIPASPAINTVAKGLKSPLYLAVDGSGNLFVTALGGFIYEVQAEGGYTTFNTYSNQLDGPAGIAVDAGGDLFISDITAGYEFAGQSFPSTGILYEIPRAPVPALTYTSPTAPGEIDTADGAQKVSLQNLGNQPLVLNGLALSSTSFTLDKASTTCTSTTTLAAGEGCTLGVLFTPVATGNPITGTLNVTDNSLNGTGAKQSLALAGTSLYAPTFVAHAPSFVFAVSQPFTMTININGPSGVAVPTGTIAVSGGSFTGTAVTLINGAAVATIPAGSFTPGLDFYNILYQPDAVGAHTYIPATGIGTVTVTETVMSVPTVTVTPAANEISLGQALSVTVDVTPPNGDPVPTGAVTLAAGSYTSPATTLNTGTVTITIPANSLVIGTDQIVATYTPDTASTTIYVPAQGQGFVAVSAAVTPAGAAPLNFGSIGIGETTAATPVTLTFPANSTPATLIATTQGATGKDYAIVGGGTCSVGVNLAAGQSCTVNVTFTPAFAGLRNGAVIAEDANGQPLASTYIYGSGTGAQVSIQSNPYLYYGEDGGSFAYSFNQVAGGYVRPSVAVDGAGNLFVADEGSGEVHEIPAGCTSTSCTITVATGISYPSDVAIDGAGNLFVAELGYDDVKKVPVGCQSPSCMESIGSGFNQPYGLAVDSSGNVFVADTYNNAIKEVVAAGGYNTINTLASGLDYPWSVGVDASDNLFVAEGGDQCTTFLVPGSCSFINTSLLEIPAAGGYTTINTLGAGIYGKPFGVAIDGAGDVYEADYGDACASEYSSSSEYAAGRRVCSGRILTFAEGLAVDGAGNLYLNDVVNGDVDKMDLVDLPSIVFKTATLMGLADTQDGPQVITVQNNGVAALKFNSIVLSDPSFQLDSTYTTCSASTPLAAGSSCSLGVDFAPVEYGPFSATLTLADDNLNQSAAVQIIQITAVALPPVPVILTNPPSSTTATSATFTFSDTQTPIAFVCSIDLLPFDTCVSGVTYSALSGGAHSFQVRAKDTLGNLSGAAVYNWTVNSVGPPAPVITSAPATMTSDTTAIFSFTDAQPVAGYQCSLDGAPFAPCTSGVSYTGLGPTGTGINADFQRHSFAVEAMDGSGNLSPQTTSSWIVTTLPLSAPPVNFGALAVGQTSSAQSVTFNITAADTIATVDATTLGITGLDFAVTDPGTCAVGTAVGKGSTCTLKVTFSPLYPGQRKGGVLLLDAAGAGIGEAYLQGTGVAPQVTFTPYATVPYSILAPQTPPSPGKTLIAPVSNITFDGAGNVYVIDEGIYSVDQSIAVSTGDIWEFPVGCTGPSCSKLTATERNAQPSTSVPLIVPTGLDMDGLGNLWGTNYELWPWILSTVGAGGPSQCFFIEDGSTLYQNDVAVDGAGIFAYMGHGILDSCFQDLGTAGQTLSFDFSSNTPSIAVDPQGNYFVADAGNNAIKEVLASSNYTIDRTVGSGFNNPTGVASDAYGNIFVSDAGNNAVKEIVAASGYTQVLTIATFDFNGYSMANLKVDAQGNVYLVNAVDVTTDPMVKLDFADAPALTFATATKIGTTDTTDGTLTATVMNNGNAPLTISALALSGVNFRVDANATTCSTSAPIAVGSSCTVGVIFTPTTAGALTGALTLTDNALNASAATQVFALSGTGFLTPTTSTPTVTVTPTSAAITTAQSDVVTVTVSGASGSPTPTGAVSLIGGNYSSAAVTLSAGSASFTIPAGVLAVGSDTLNAVYSPDNVSSSIYGAGASSAKITVTAAAKSTPTVSMTPALIDVSTQQSLAVAIAVSGSTGDPTPSGTVTLSGGNFASLAVTLTNGSVTITIPAGYLPAGPNTLSAYYTPNATGQVNYTSASGTSQVSVETAPKATPAVVVTPAATSIKANQTLQVTLAVSGGAGQPAPTGSVVLSSGSFVSAAAVLSKGAVIVNIPAGALAVGGDVLTAAYTPDNASSLTFNSAAGTASVNVNSQFISTTTTVKASPASVAYGANVSFSIAVTPSSGTGTPTGSVVLMDGSSTLTTQTLSGGAAGYSTSTLSAGTHSITAVYGGDSNYSGSTSAAVTVTVAAAAPVATLTPTLAFPSTNVGTTSSAIVATLSNSGNATLNISSIAIGGTNPIDFAVATGANVCGATLAANATCSIYVTFTPASAIGFSATLTVTDNATPTTQSATLTGTGTAPEATLTPTLAFPSTNVGKTSSALFATLSNSGNANLNISGIAIGGANPSDFAITTGSNACGTTLAADASCSVYVTFTPASATSLSATLTVTDNATPTTQSATLTGTGTPAPAPIAALTPSLSFTSTTVGTTSSALFATLSNSGNATLNISSIAIGGTNPGDFTVTTGTNACGTTLAADASCSIYVTFTPASAAGFSATLTVTDNATPTTQSIALMGTGTPPPAPVASLTPAMLTFTSVSGTTSTAQTATLSNTGNATLSISGINIGGTNTSDFAVTTGSNACGTTLAADASCSIYVTFTPVSAAGFSASLQVTDNASGSPQSTTLNGTGTPPPSFTISSNSGAQTIQPGGTATYTITVSAQNGTFSNAVLLSASGLPTGATGTFTPPSVTPGSASATSTLSIATGTTTASARSGPLWPLAAPALAVIGLCFLPGKQRRRWITLGLLLFASLGAFTALAACGGGFALTQPAQSYTITVTGTSGADVQTTTVQLTVQ